MQKKFRVKLPSHASAPTGEYVVVACPKCGKKTYGVVGQKGKRCPVCRHQFYMTDNPNAPRFKTPEAACRFIQAEEAKRAGRMDFAHAGGGFCPASCAPVITRTNKILAEAKTLEAQFLTWARQYFTTVVGNSNAGIPMTEVIAAATKAGFAGAGNFIENAVNAGFIIHPKPYSLWIAGFLT